MNLVIVASLCDHCAAIRVAHEPHGLFRLTNGLRKASGVVAETSEGEFDGVEVVQAPAMLLELKDHLGPVCSSTPEAVHENDGAGDGRDSHDGV